MRLHKKVWMWYGRWWAVQLQRGGYFSLGVHVDWSKPYVDLHLWNVIVSVGNNPVMTYWRDKYRGSCRGFYTEDIPVL
jgi:hypothetical protein